MGVALRIANIRTRYGVAAVGKLLQFPFVQFTSGCEIKTSCKTNLAKFPNHTRTSIASFLEIPRLKSQLTANTVFACDPADQQRLSPQYVFLNNSQREFCRESNNHRSRTSFRFLPQPYPSLR